MKVLIDECVRWPLRKILAAHECQTAQHCGWAGLKNGERLGHAEEKFDHFLTADQNIRYQQNLSGRQIAILEFSTNDLRRLLPRSRSFSRPSTPSNPANLKFLLSPEALRLVHVSCGQHPRLLGAKRSIIVPTSPLEPIGLDPLLTRQRWPRVLRTGRSA